MAQRKKKDAAISADVDLDKIITEQADSLELTPTNLIRGGCVKDAVSTGSLALDLVLGGGWPPGRRSNVFGREQGGKSTLLYYAVKACISAGIHTVFYDFEGSTEGDRMQRIGVQIDWAKELAANEPVLFRYYDRMKHGEQVFRHAKRVLDRLPDKDTGPVQIVFFLDSLPTVIPEAQADDDETGANALRARLFSDQLPLIKSRLAAKRCIWIDTNQLKTNPRQLFGNPEYEMCGDAVKTLSDVRVKAKKTVPPPGRGRSEKKSYIEEEACWDRSGVDKYTFSQFYITKNKSFSPFRECTLRIWFEEAGIPGRGIDPVYDVFEYLSLTGQIRLVKRKMRESDKDKKPAFLIDIAPFNEERVVGLPKPKVDAKGEDTYNAETGEVEMEVETLKRDFWSWGDLKDLILNPANTKGADRKKWDIIAACRDQINDNSAFERYFANIVAAGSAPDADDDGDGDDTDGGKGGKGKSR
jgi:RecA/RadA recombinase